MTRERREFQRLCLEQLQQCVKGTEWKKASNVVYRVEKDFFLAATLAVHLNSKATHATFEVKPIAVDPILWEILDMPENASEPMSFRANGAFTCPMPELAHAEIEPPATSPMQVAAELLAFASRSAASFFEHLKARPFIHQLEQHPNQRERGAYATTLVASHIAEGNSAEATTIARSYSSGEMQSCLVLSSKGRTFHDLAIEWLSRKHGNA